MDKKKTNKNVNLKKLACNARGEHSLYTKLRQSSYKRKDTGESKDNTPYGCDEPHVTKIDDVSAPKFPRIAIEDINCVSRLDARFFRQNCVKLAKDLLGRILVRELNGERLSGMIVETEAYVGTEDKAAHSYKGKQTKRNEAMFMKEGTIYVYNIYGMYTCINISSQGDGCAVLIRAIEPLSGLESLRKQRLKYQKSNSHSPKTTKTLKDVELCNGPSKLTQAMAIDKLEFNKTSLFSADSLIWLEQGTQITESNIIACPRIGINYADDWADKPLRFYIRGNKYVSKRNKVSEGLV